MKKIASFTVNHLDLLRGVYVSRRDVTPSGDVLTTFDVRMTEPNRQPALSPQALVYWGPMGCCTGNYLILNGEYEPRDILPLLRETFGFIAGFEGEVPGATPRDCGNYSFMNLEDARAAARRYLDEVLASPTEANLVYPA